jgi:hypothetical protein
MSVTLAVWYAACFVASFLTFLKQQELSLFPVTNGVMLVP